MEFLAENCQGIIHLNIQFQHVNATKVYDALIDQYTLLSSRAESYLCDASKCKILSAAAKKAKKYALDGHQPAMPLFKAARLFDPYFYITLNTNFEDYIQVIPELAACKDEGHIYYEITFFLMTKSSLLLYMSGLINAASITSPPS